MIANIQVSPLPYKLPTMKKVILLLAFAATTSKMHAGGGVHGLSLFCIGTGASIQSSSFKLFAAGYNNNANVTKKVGSPSFGFGTGIGGRAMYSGVSMGFGVGRYNSSASAGLIDGGSRTFKFTQTGYDCYLGFLLGGETRTPVFLLVGASVGSDKLQISHTPGTNPTLYSTAIDGTYKELGLTVPIGIEGAIGLKPDSKIRLFYRAVYAIKAGNGVSLYDGSKPYSTSQVGSDYALWSASPSSYLGDYISSDQHGLRLALGITLDLWGTGDDDE
jgi:hypothetical protein